MGARAEHGVLILVELPRAQLKMYLNTGRSGRRHSSIRTWILGTQISEEDEETSAEIEKELKAIREIRKR